MGTRTLTSYRCKHLLDRVGEDLSWDEQAVGQIVREHRSDDHTDKPVVAAVVDSIPKNDGDVAGDGGTKEEAEAEEDNCLIGAEVEEGRA